MSVRVDEPRRRFSIAFVSQGMGGIGPGGVAAGSVAIWTAAVSRRLAAAGHTVYAYEHGTSRFATRRVRTEGVDIVYVPCGLNRFVNRTFAKTAQSAGARRRGGRRGSRPFFAAFLYNFGFALLAALDIRRRRPDIAHVHTFPQNAALIALLNPRVRVQLPRCRRRAGQVRRYVDRLRGDPQRRRHPPVLSVGAAALEGG
jgi:hypothetical protein